MSGYGSLAKNNWLRCRLRSCTEVISDRLNGPVLLVPTMPFGINVWMFAIAPDPVVLSFDP